MSIRSERLIVRLCTHTNTHTKYTQFVDVQINWNYDERIQVVRVREHTFFWDVNV